MGRRRSRRGRRRLHRLKLAPHHSIPVDHATGWGHGPANAESDDCACRPLRVAAAAKLVAGCNAALIAVDVGGEGRGGRQSVPVAHYKYMHACMHARAENSEHLRPRALRPTLRARSGARGRHADALERARPEGAGVWRSLPAPAPSLRHSSPRHHALARQVKKWKQQMRGESRKIDRQIRGARAARPCDRRSRPIPSARCHLALAVWRQRARCTLAAAPLPQVACALSCARRDPTDTYLWLTPLTHG